MASRDRLKPVRIKKKISGEVQWKIMVKSKQVAQPFTLIVAFSLVH